MSDLLNKIITNDRQALDAAKAQYVELITRMANDSEEAGDESLIRTLMSSLSLEPKHIEADLAIMRDVLQFQQSIDDANAQIPELSEANRKAIEKRDAAYEAYDTAQREANIALMKLSGAQNQRFVTDPNSKRRESPRLSGGVFPIDSDAGPKPVTNGPHHVLSHNPNAKPAAGTDEWKEAHGDTDLAAEIDKSLAGRETFERPMATA